jgi:hypothetical protein
MRPFCPPFMLYFLPISLFSIWSPKYYFVRSTEHKALRCVVFSSPLLFCSS